MARYLAVVGDLVEDVVVWPVGLLRHRARESTGVLLTVPVPAADELHPQRHDAALAAALDAAREAGTTGAAVTPFVLERVGRETGDGSVPANLALAENNASVAAEVAVALSQDGADR